MVGMCGVGLIFLCSFDVTPISLEDKVLVHLVLPRSKIVYVEFLGKKGAFHLSIHVEFLLLLCDTNSTCGCYSDRLVLRERELSHNTLGWTWIKLESALIPCKESDVILCSGNGLCVV